MKLFLYISFLLSLLFAPFIRPHYLVPDEPGSVRSTWAKLVKDNGPTIKYEGYEVSFDENMHIPRYVAYCLKAEEVVDGPRPSGFQFQMDVDCGLVQADVWDYKGTGWSRGHMAPAADFKWSLKAYGDTFYYTNCCPQDQAMNNGSWNVLENHVRRLARKYGQIYMVTGPVVGTNRFGKIGEHQVVVPDGFFKALLVHRDNRFYAIGFYMDNVPDKQSLRNSYLTIDNLERLTGYDFFPFLEDSVENTVEVDVDTSVWF